MAHGLQPTCAQKVEEDRPCGFRVMRAEDGQTNKQTHHNNLALLPEAK